MSDLYLSMDRPMAAARNGAGASTMPEIGGRALPVNATAVSVPQRGEEAVARTLAVAKALGLRAVRREGWDLTLRECFNLVSWPVDIKVSHHSHEQGTVLVIEPLSAVGAPSGSTHALGLVRAFAKQARRSAPDAPRRRFRSLVTWLTIVPAAVLAATSVDLWPRIGPWAVLFFLWALLVMPQLGELAQRRAIGIVTRRDLVTVFACAGVLAVCTLVFAVIRLAGA